MPRRTSIRFPSFKNLQIYHSLAYERRTQTALAKELGLSQRRVSQIGQQVRAWVDSIVPARQYIGEDGNRFHLAIASERIRLREAYDPLVEMFTGPDGLPRYLKRQIAVVDGQALNTVEVGHMPPLQLFNQAVDVVARQGELEAIANCGPFADVPNQFHRTTIHRFTTAAPDPNEISSSPSANPNPCPSNASQPAVTA